MPYQATFEALADPQRRTMVERLRGGPLPAGKLGEGLPISQPAASRHLRVLRESGLVSERREGRRRIYSLEQPALADLRCWVNALWDTGLTAFRVAAESSYDEGSRT